MLTNSTIGGGLGLLTALALSNKRNRLRNSLFGGAVGAALGGYGTLVADNIRTEMGGHYRKNPEYYNINELLRRAKNANKDSIVLYVAGADDTTGGRERSPVESSETDNGVFVYRWGDGRYLAKAIKALKDAGYKTDVISHSAGATAVFDALDDTTKVNSVHLLDPVDLSLSLRPMLNKLYNAYKDRLTNSAVNPVLHVALNREYNPEDASSVPNKSITFNPLAVTSIPGIKTIKHADNHGMHTTGLRMPWNPAETLEWLRQVRDKLSV